MLRRTFLASSIGATIAGFLAPMLSKLGRKPQTAVCAATKPRERAATAYYANLSSGDDANPGTAERPFKTLQPYWNSAIASDNITLHVSGRMSVPGYRKGSIRA